jgi:hypothetical protein
MPNFTRYTTAYSEYVFSNVVNVLAVGQGAYDMHTLAGMVGLKPTHNFRKRVRQMVAEGRIATNTVFTPRGGLAIVYTLPDTTKNEENTL